MNANKKAANPPVAPIRDRSVSIVAVEHGLHPHLGLRAPMSKWSMRRTTQLADVRDYLLAFRPRHVVAWLPRRPLRGVDVLDQLLEMLRDEGVGSCPIEAPSICRSSPFGQWQGIEHVIDAGFLAQRRRALRTASLRDRVGWLNDPDARPYLDASVAARGPILPIKRALDPLVGQLRSLANAHGRILVMGEWVAMRGLCSSVVATSAAPQRTAPPNLQTSDAGGVRLRA